MEFKKRSSRDWTKLHSLPIRLISEKLPTNLDIISFRSVCTSWREDATNPFPWMLIRRKRSVSFIDRSGTQFKLEREGPPKISFPGEVVLGSYPGWVTLASRNPSCLKHYQLITKTSKILPSFMDLSSRNLNLREMKTFISTDPRIGDSITLLIGKRKNEACCFFAICKDTSQNWATMPVQPLDFVYELPLLMTPPLFHNNHVYVIFGDQLILLRIVEEEGLALNFHGRYTIEDFEDEHINFLVQSEGHILIVRYNSETRKCEIFSVELLAEGGMNLTKVVNLGDRSLFLSNDICFSVTGSKYQHCLENHLYIIYNGFNLEEFGCSMQVSVNYATGYQETLVNQDFNPMGWLLPGLLRVKDNSL